MHGLKSWSLDLQLLFQVTDFCFTEKLHSNWYEISISLQSCLQQCLRLVNSETFPPRKQITTTQKASVSLYQEVASAHNIFELQTPTAREHFAPQESGLSQIFKLIVSSSENRLHNTNVAVWTKVK